MFFIIREMYKNRLDDNPDTRVLITKSKKYEGLDLIETHEYTYIPINTIADIIKLANQYGSVALVSEDYCGKSKLTLSDYTIVVGFKYLE